MNGREWIYEISEPEGTRGGGVSPNLETVKKDMACHIAYSLGMD